MRVQLSASRKVTAWDSCRRLGVSEDAIKVLRPEMTPGEFVGELMERELYRDAARVIAGCLPAAHGVRWACVAARGIRDSLTVAALGALDAAERWVISPDERVRAECWTAAQDAGLDNAGAWAAAAAFWSGGSIAPAGSGTAVEPPEHLFPLAVMTAISLAAVAAEPTQIEARFRSLVMRGIDVANGGRGRGGDGARMGLSHESVPR